MEEDKQSLPEKIAATFTALVRLVTSWYIAPFWIILLGMLLGQPLWLCVVLAVAFGILGSKL